MRGLIQQSLWKTGSASLPLVYIDVHQRDKREDIRLMAINESLDMFCMYLFR